MEQAGESHLPVNTCLKHIWHESHAENGEALDPTDIDPYHVTLYRRKSSMQTLSCPKGFILPYILYGSSNTSKTYRETSPHTISRQTSKQHHSPNLPIIPPAFHPTPFACPFQRRAPPPPFRLSGQEACGHGWPLRMSCVNQPPHGKEQRTWS